MSTTSPWIPTAQVAALEQRIRRCVTLRELKDLGREIRALCSGASWESRRGDREALAVWRAAYTVRRVQLKRAREG